MKLSVCDICYSKEGKVVRATRRVGWKGGLKFDVCNDHRDYTKGKTEKEVALDYYGTEIQ